jgi:hypothetical protein
MQYCHFTRPPLLATTTKKVLYHLFLDYRSSHCMLWRTRMFPEPAWRWWPIARRPDHSRSVYNIIKHFYGYKLHLGVISWYISQQLYPNLIFSSETGACTSGAHSSEQSNSIKCDKIGWKSLTDKYQIVSKSFSPNSNICR